MQTPGGQCWPLFDLEISPGDGKESFDSWDEKTVGNTETSGKGDFNDKQEDLGRWTSVEQGAVPGAAVGRYDSELLEEDPVDHEQHG